ncbi:bifunctional nuclease family protein [Thermogladius sp.]|uniref:bifunctional nuclease family protein n=1 Tax=Thermogladius sp. TaxID=2023064 RepID=UPI003D0EB47F
MTKYLLVKRVRDEIGEVKVEGLDLYMPVPRLVCELEDGRSFYLERVPYDVIIFVKKINGGVIDDDRERLGDLLISMPEVLEALGKHVKRVLIEEFDETRGVYSAYVEFNDGELTIKRKMVPSHAILLALLVSKPVYVKKELVDAQEALFKQ